MLKGVIFDLDGTLIDTIADIGNSTNMMLREYGLPEHDLSTYKLMVGNGFKELVKRALPKGKEDLIDEAYDKFVYYYNLHYMDETSPYPGVLELLQDLQDKDIKMAVNSNKRDDYTKALLKSLFKDVDFIEIVGQREGLRPKPYSDGTNVILKAMNLAKEEVVFVGDTKVDIETGKNANLKTIGCLWGFRDESELKEAGADYIVREPKEIIDIIFKY